MHPHLDAAPKLRGRFSRSCGSATPQALHRSLRFVAKPPSRSFAKTPSYRYHHHPPTPPKSSCPFHHGITPVPLPKLNRTDQKTLHDPVYIATPCTGANHQEAIPTSTWKRLAPRSSLAWAVRTAPPPSAPPSFSPACGPGGRGWPRRWPAVAGRLAAVAGFRRVRVRHRVVVAVVIDEVCGMKNSQDK